MNVKRLYDYITPSLLLRIGVAFPFLYVALNSLFSPNLWTSFVPTFITNLIPVQFFMAGLLVMHFVLVLWLLSGFMVEYACLIVVIFMSGIIIFDFSALTIVFRDISILFAALALGLMSIKKQK